MQVPTQSGPTRVPIDKSVGIAFLLTFFFGPLGLFYVSVLGAIVMICVAFLGILTFGVGTVFAWGVSILWACVAASRKHSLFQAWLASGGVGNVPNRTGGVTGPSPIVVQNHTKQVLIFAGVGALVLLLSAGSLVRHFTSSSASDNTPTATVGNSGQSTGGGNSTDGNSGTVNAGVGSSGSASSGSDTPTTDVTTTTNNSFAQAQQQATQADNEQNAADNIQSAADPIPSDQSALASDEDTLTSDESTLSEDVTTVSSDLATVKNDYATVQSDALSDPESVCGDAGSLNGDVGSMQGDQGSFGGDVNSSNSDITNLQHDEATLESDWSSYQTALKSNADHSPLSGLPTKSGEELTLSGAGSAITGFNAAVNQDTQQIASYINQAKGVAAQAQQLCNSSQ